MSPVDYESFLVNLTGPMYYYGKSNICAKFYRYRCSTPLTDVYTNIQTFIVNMSPSYICNATWINAPLTPIGDGYHGPGEHGYHGSIKTRQLRIALSTIYT